jgi:hypothetical protein
MKPPKFNSATSWAVFHRQEVALVQNNWTPNEKVAHLLSALQGQAADILYTVPSKATYEDIAGALWDCSVEHLLEVAYWLQLKGRVKISGKMLEYAAAMEQLTH